MNVLLAGLVAGKAEQMPAVMQVNSCTYMPGMIEVAPSSTPTK